MADSNSLELEDILNRPGTYFNPQTEVLIIVDDSQELDAEIFNMEEFEGADWVRISVSAKSCAISWIASCSSVSVKSITVAGSP
jgi:hypothetical protein